MGRAVKHKAVPRANTPVATWVRFPSAPPKLISCYCDAMAKKKKPPHFGALLAQAAERQGVVQTELARRLKCTQHRISEIYRSENLTEVVFRKCCKALRVRLDVRLIKERQAA